MQGHNENIGECPIGALKEAIHKGSGYHNAFCENTNKFTVLYGTKFGTVEEQKATKKTIGFLKILTDSFRLLSKSSCASQLRKVENRPGIGATGTKFSGIASGYVYLLQFAMHDLTQTSINRRGIGTSELSARNLRQTGLILDTLFGGGAQKCPFPFEPVDRGTDLQLSRSKLRLGKVSGIPAGPLDNRSLDLARSSSKNHPADNKEKLYDDVMIADPRNDANSIIGQLTVIFSALHNQILRELEERSDELSCPNEMVSPVAQAITVLVYHNVLRCDVLQKFLHPAVFRFYEYSAGLNEPIFFDRPNDPTSIPVEFSHAAGRLGHLMIHPSYQINDATNHETEVIVQTTSFKPSSKASFNTKNIIDWNLFFPTFGSSNPPEKFNWSLNIGFQIPNFFDLGEWFTPFPKQATKDRPAGHPGLIYKDLSRGIAVGLRPVANMANRSIKPKLDSLLKKSTDKEERQELEELSLVLDEELFDKSARDTVVNNAFAILKQTYSPMGNHEEIFKQQVPLFVYLIAESAFGRSGGRHLGALGSLIIAEVFYRAIHQAPKVLNFKEAEPIANTLFGGKLPNTMECILRYLGRNPTPYKNLY